MRRAPGKWSITRKPGRWSAVGVEVLYDNLLTGRRVSCGTMSSDCPDEVLVEWLIEVAKPAPGDTVVLSDGQWFRTGAVA